MTKLFFSDILASMKKDIKQIALALGAALFVTATLTGTAQAAGTNSKCQVIYGGGEVCTKEVQFSLDKQVKSPNGDFVDTLQSNDPKYSPNQNIDFKVIIENTGNSTIDSMEVHDTLPQYLTYVSGPGNYDENTKKISFTVADLEAGEKVEHTITTKVVEDTLLPQDKGVVCVINQVQAIERDGAQAEDSSQACIERQVLGAKPAPKVFDTPDVKQTPDTGPGMLALISLLPAGAAGMFLRRKAK